VAVVSLFALVTGMFVAALVQLTQQTGKSAVGFKKEETIYQLAEAAVERGIWKLMSDQSYWGLVGSGTPITGYNNDVTYQDFPSPQAPMGSYKIKIEKDPMDSAKRIITGVAKDAAGANVYAIQATFTKVDIDSAVQIRAGGKKKNKWRNDLIVHWGPVVMYNNIKLEGAAKNREWPQKYSTGYIDPRDTNPSPPNTDNLEYWTYQSLGTPPPIDFDYYRQAAKASTGIPEPTKGGPASPPGSGYFPGKGRIEFKSYQLNNPDAVIFIENAESVMIKDTPASPTFIKCQAMIILGGKIHWHVYGQTLTADVPANAWEQYQSGRVNDDNDGDTAATGEYPGDGGYHVSNPTYGIPNCWFHGYLYVNRFKCSGSPVNPSAMFGVLDVGSQFNANKKAIYYDPAIASSIQIYQNNLTRVSWKRLKTTWPE